MASVGLIEDHVRNRTMCRMLLLSFAFHDLNFCLSSQLKAASCARCSSEMPPSKQVNGHSFTIKNYASLFGVYRSRRVARRCNPTQACCCGMVPRSFGTCLAGSIGHGAGPFPVAGWWGPWSRTCLVRRWFGSATVCGRGLGWSGPHPGG